MHRYVIARVSAPRATALAPASEHLEILDAIEVDRIAFLRICFHMKRSVPRRGRPRAAQSSVAP